MLVAVAGFAVNFSAVGPAVAHPDHNCPNGQERPNYDGAPCVQEWGVATMEWCRASGLTVRRMTADYGGVYQFRSNSSMHGAAVQLLRNFSESHQHACYWKTASWTTVPDLSVADQQRCSNSGYRLYVQQRTNNSLGEDDFDFFCMPPKINQGSHGSNYDLNLARRGPHCVNRSPGELYRPDAHECSKAPVKPVNLSIRVVSPGELKVSWQLPSGDGIFADYYILERAETRGSPLLTVTTHFPATSPSARAMTVDVTAPRHSQYLDNSNFRSYGLRAFRVLSGASDASFDGGGSFQDSEYSDPVRINTHDYLEACVGAGWSADRSARTCPIPWERASDGATGDFCRVSINDPGEGLTCLAILTTTRFGIDYDFPAKSDVPAGDRVVFNCPRGRSADMLECTCPSNHDLLPKTGGGYECRLRLNCANQNREQTDLYTCGVCLPGHDDVGGVCRERLNCVADHNRAQTDPYTCGPCVAGHREFRGGQVCRLDRRISVQDVDAHCPDDATLNAADGAVVGRVCRQSAAEDWCFVLNYEQAAADGALSSFHIGGDTAVKLPANPMSCDDAYPPCGGENYGRTNPFAPCECFGGFIQSNPAAPDNRCERDCAALHRDAAAGLLNCGECSAGFAEDVDGSGICHAVVDCSAEQNRLQRSAYQCAGCEAGYAEDDAGVCRERITCPAGHIQLNAYECGGCLSGFAPDESDACQPILDCAAQNKLQVNPYTCGACESGLPDDNGNCRDTPRADLCESSGGSIMQFAVSLNSNECVPVQKCAIQTPHQNAAWECYVWSDAGRPESEVFADAVDSVHSTISAAGECEGTGEALTNFPNDRTCQIRWNPATRNFCESKMLRDPNNIFSECADDYGQGACEEAGGEWKLVSHDVDPPPSWQANTCILNGAGCYVNAGRNFDADASVFYDFEHPHHSTDETLTEFHERYPAPLTGPCEDAYPNTCQLSTAGNAFLGCAQISRPGTPKVSVTMSSPGTVFLEWEESVAADGDASQILGYSVLRQEGGGATVSVGFTTATIYTDANAPRERGVRYQIRTEQTVASEVTLTSPLSEAVRVPGCAAAAHSGVVRPNAAPLCVPDAAHEQAQLCADAGWGVIYRKPLSPNGHVRCNIGVRDAQSGEESQCGILGDNPTACSELFGTPPVFPVYAGTERRYVLNCGDNRVADPAYESQNSARQECVCGEGYFEEDGQCAACESIGRAGVSGSPGVCAEGCAGDAVLTGDVCLALHSVSAAHIPADGSGGTLSATAAFTILAEGGRAVLDGTRATFIALPAADYYVSGWSHPLCAAEGGDAALPAVERKCSFAVFAESHVTVTFAAAYALSDAPGDFAAELLLAVGGGPTVARLNWTAPPETGTPVTLLLLQGAARNVASAADCAAEVFAEGDYAPLSAPAPGATTTRDANAGDAGYGVCRSYRLAAQTRRGRGAFARVNVFIHAPPSPPGAPLAAAIAAGGVSLSWAAAAEENGSPILGYDILREVNGAGGFVSIAFATGTAYVDSLADVSAPAGTTISVKYRARARNAAGAGAASDDSNEAAVVRDCETGQVRVNDVCEAVAVCVPPAVLNAVLNRCETPLYAVSASHLPANGEGGGLRASGSFTVLADGGRGVVDGARVTFAASPAADFYVSGWSHSDCAEAVGSDAAPGAKQECAFAVEAAADVTVTFSRGVSLAAAPGDFSATLDLNGGTVAVLEWTPPANAGTVTLFSLQRATRMGLDAASCAAGSGKDLGWQTLDYGDGFAGTEGEWQPVPWLTGATIAAADIAEGAVQAKWSAPLGSGESELLFVHTTKSALLTAGTAGVGNTRNSALPGELFFLRIHGGFLEWRKNIQTANIKRLRLFAKTTGTIFADSDYAALASPTGDAVSARDENAGADGFGVCKGYRLAAQTRRGAGAWARANVFVECPKGTRMRGEVCVPKEGDFGGLSDGAVCVAFGGDLVPAGSPIACSGVDESGTFCLLDSREVFPCRGLFKRARFCNFKHNRILLNPFVCGRACVEGETATGRECAQ